jgi:hypothetical protein
MITRRRGVREMAPAVFMKPFAGGGDESQTRPPPGKYPKCRPPGRHFAVETTVFSRRDESKSPQRRRLVARTVHRLSAWTGALAGTPSLSTGVAVDRNGNTHDFPPANDQFRANFRGM